jgi:hypothetical protein
LFLVAIDVIGIWLDVILSEFYIMAHPKTPLIHPRTSLISQDIISSKDSSHLTKQHLIPGLLSSHKTSTHSRTPLISQDIISFKASLIHKLHRFQGPLESSKVIFSTTDGHLKMKKQLGVL